MGKPYPLLKSLTDQLMKEVKAYGILGVSTEQYQNACNSIIKFGESKQVVSYSPELADSYRSNLDRKCSLGEICKEYRRFQLRVVRMLSSIVESGKVDFSNAKPPLRKYLVSEETVTIHSRFADTINRAEL